MVNRKRIWINNTKQLYKNGCHAVFNFVNKNSVEKKYKDHSLYQIHFICFIRENKIHFLQRELFFSSPPPDLSIMPLFSSTFPASYQGFFGVLFTSGRQDLSSSVFQSPGPFLSGTEQPLSSSLCLVRLVSRSFSLCSSSSGCLMFRRAFRLLFDI